MNKKQTKNIAKQLGISMKNESCSGIYGGYPVAAVAYPDCTMLTVAAGIVSGSDAQERVGGLISELLAQKDITKCIYERNALRLLVDGNDAMRIQKILDSITLYFAEKGFEAVCCCCGNPAGSMEFFEINGKRDFLCEACVDKLVGEVRAKKIHVGQYRSNLFTGFVGALAGIHIGLVLFMLMSGWGWNSTIPTICLVLLLCLGYWLLGGCMDGKGAAMCTFLALLYFPISQYLSVTHLIYVTYRKTLVTTYLMALLMTPEVIKTSVEILGEFMLEIGAAFFSSAFVFVFFVRYLYLCNKRGYVFKRL